MTKKRYDTNCGEGEAGQVTGYVRIFKPELKLREYEQYRGIYCSLCKQLGERYGALLRMALSYDMTFYAVFAMALQSDCVGFRASHCSYNPFKKCLHCTEQNVLATAADVTALMFYYRLLDHLADEGYFKRLGVRLILPIAKRYHRKAAANQPALDRAFADMMAKQERLERDACDSIDVAAEPFAELLRYMCVLLSTDEKQQKVLERFGYCLGRYVYLSDAAADLKQDAKKGSYNPFIHNRRLQVNDKKAVEETQQYALDVLRHCQAECMLAYELLEIHRFDGILRNILQEGMHHVLAHLFETERGKKHEYA